MSWPAPETPANILKIHMKREGDAENMALRGFSVFPVPPPPNKPNSLMGFYPYNAGDCQLRWFAPTRRHHETDCENALKEAQHEWFLSMKDKLPNTLYMTTYTSQDSGHVFNTHNHWTLTKTVEYELINGYGPCIIAIKWYDSHTVGDPPTEWYSWTLRLLVHRGGPVGGSSYSIWPYWNVACGHTPLYPNQTDDCLVWVREYYPWMNFSDPIPDPTGGSTQAYGPSGFYQRYFGELTHCSCTMFHFAIGEAQWPGG